MDHIYIWWLDKWHLMATHMLLEEADRGNHSINVLPGHIKMALDNACGCHYGGQLYPPVTLEAAINPDHLNNAGEEANLAAILTNGWFGIPFEEVHLRTIKQYPGIITTYALKAIRK
ncbi:hypothetical protein D3C78_614120 [compost metagenome]